MKETPILFTGEMVRAILSGTKSQTRRVVKPQPISNPAGPNYDGLWSDTKDPVTRYFGCPYGQPGDRLWVRETHWLNTGDIGVPAVVYRADNPPLAGKPNAIFPWRPSIFMPRWASRITLEIEAVRVERVQDISEEDAMAEGVDWQATAGLSRFTAKKLYSTLWDSINGKKHSWASNPWVWVLTFKRI